MTAHVPTISTLSTRTASAHRDAALLAPRRGGRPAAGTDDPGQPAPTIQRRTGTVAPRPLDLDPASRAVEAERLAAAVSRWYVEALAGRRDTRQLRRMLTPVVEHRVRACVLRATTALRGSGVSTSTPTVRNVLVRPVADRYEAVAMVSDGARTTAVVAVLHPTERGWIISELARPEDNLPAQPVPAIR